MKTYTAIYKVTKTSNVKHTIGEYASKQGFRKELNSNGLKVLAILSQEEIEKIHSSHWSDRTELYQEYVDQVLR